MAAPAIVPILKKIAVAVVSDKRGRKALFYIIATIVIILLLPIIILQAIFSTPPEFDMGEVNEIIASQEAIEETTLSEIDKQMLEAGFSDLKIEEAQSVYFLVLIDKCDQDLFVERLVGCFKEEQTDAELIDAINTEFGTEIEHEEFTEAMQEIRDKYKNQEEKTDEKE